MNIKCPDTLDIFSLDMDQFKSTYLTAKQNSVFHKVLLDSFLDKDNPDFDCDGCTAYPLVSPDKLNIVTGYFIRGEAHKYDASQEPHKLLEKKTVSFNVGAGELAINTSKKYLSYAIGTNDIKLFVKIAEAGEAVIYHSDINKAYQILNKGMPESIFRLLVGKQRPVNNSDLFIQADESFEALSKTDIKKLLLEKVDYLKKSIDPDSFIQPPLADMPQKMPSTLKKSLPSLEIINMSDIQPQPIRWLWDGWLPLGKMTILAGAGGCGKTNLSLALIATITTGGVFPDGSKCTNVGRVIIYSTEDDLADTLIPRLIANGVDESKISFIGCRTNEKGEKEPFDPSQDFPVIEGHIKANPDVKLLMIDPIVSAVSGDMNKANDVRRSLQPLKDLAEEYKFAVLGITHFSKGSSGSTPADRVIGSQAFTAFARMVWVASKREDEGDCILVRAKSNNSILEGGVRYQIESETIVGNLDNIETTKTVWLGTIEGTAKELLGEAENTDGRNGSTLDLAKEFLIDLLGSVEKMAASEVLDEAKNAGYSVASIRRAKDNLNIKPFKDGSAWYWKLPSIFKDVPQILPEYKQRH